MRHWSFAASALVMVAAPALADVQAGSEAWARGEYRRAVEEWRGPAVAGDPVAQYNLGQAYKLGRGVPVDPALAESWFRKAALQGLAEGQDNYGLALFQAGRKADALPWLEKSAARGEPRTQLVLGTMLFNGDGGARDYPRAYALMTRAAAAGLTSASETLAQMDQYISPADRERGTALAQKYAAEARPVAASNTMRVTDLPPTRVAEPAVATSKPAPKPTAKPAQSAPATVAKATPPAVTGGWKAQLGAFRDRANAEALWAKLHARLGPATPAYTTVGSLTRLQATGFASKADAQKACAAAGPTCMLVAP